MTGEARKKLNAAKRSLKLARHHDSGFHNDTFASVQYLTNTVERLIEIIDLIDKDHREQMKKLRKRCK